VEASRGGVPEFHAGMEKEESERLEEARKTIIAEQDRWREILIEREKEIQRLQREVDELGS
jgi:YEATS domain-containing protein 4